MATKFKLNYSTENLTEEAIAEAEKLSKFLANYTKHKLKKMFIKHWFVSLAINYGIYEGDQAEDVSYDLLGKASYPINKKYREGYPDNHGVDIMVSLNGFSDTDWHICILPNCITSQFNNSILVPVYKELCNDIISTGKFSEVITIADNIDIKVSGFISYNSDNITVLGSLNAIPCSNTLTSDDYLESLHLNEDLEYFLQSFFRVYHYKLECNNVLTAMDEWLKRNIVKDLDDSRLIKHAVYGYVEAMIRGMTPWVLDEFVVDNKVYGCEVRVEDILSEIGNSVPGMEYDRLENLIDKYNNRLLKSGERVAESMKRRTRFNRSISVDNTVVKVYGSYKCYMDNDSIFRNDTFPIIDITFKIKSVNKEKDGEG